MFEKKNAKLVWEKTTLGVSVVIIFLRFDEAALSFLLGYFWVSPILAGPI